MKILIVDDDFASRRLLQLLLKNHGPLHVASNGREAVASVQLALENGEPYHLICLNIMMPELDGQEALKQIRTWETVKGIGTTDRAKIVMTTAQDDKENIGTAFNRRCDAYLVKPINPTKLRETLRHLHLIR